MRASALPIADPARRGHIDGMNGNLSDNFDLDRDRRSVLRSYSSSLMSNTKWRAVFKALEGHSLGIRQITTKFVDVAEAKSMSLPTLLAPSAVDSIEFGPFPLIAIEGIEVPAVAIFQRCNNLPAERYTQNVEAVRSALTAIGKKLPLADTTTGLRVLGHVR